MAIWLIHTTKYNKHMDQPLPALLYEDLMPIRDYLREVALVLGSLQRGFLPPHPRLWQHGLEINLRGLSTQAFELKGGPTRASLDLVKHKVRLGGNKWALQEYAPPEIFANIKLWLESQGIHADLEEPDFASDAMSYDTAQAEAYATALWWLDEQFRDLKAELKGRGVTSPILLYPHHFDLSLVWFPWDDERQLSIGWSTGDETIAEPYLYLTAYPEPPSFKDLSLPDGAFWQSAGFSGAILPYAALRLADTPTALFKQFTATLLTGADDQSRLRSRDQ